MKGCFKYNAHALQKRARWVLKHGNDYALANRTKLEIEAQDELLRIGEAEGWSQAEMDRIRAARESWVKKLAEEQCNEGQSTGSGG
jgi:hypothetical protein